LQEEAKRLGTFLNQTATIVPAVLSQVPKTIPIEVKYFSCVELRKILGNVLTLPGERNFRTVDTQSDTYQKRLAPVPQVVQLLSEFGFKPTGADGRYLVIEEADLKLAHIQSGLNDLNDVISRLAGSTPIFKATLALISKNPTTAAAVVEKLQAAIKRILADPHEQKYHKFKLEKFFKATGQVEGGRGFLSLFGFEVDIISGIAKLPYPGLDVELLRLRLEDLTRSWDDALAVIRQRRAADNKMQIDG